MEFNEREAIRTRMEQIFVERQNLQEEYKHLFSRLREIDERELSPNTLNDRGPLTEKEKDEKFNEKQIEVHNKKFEDLDKANDEQEQIDTEEYDKRLDQLQYFLDENS
jgi:hypothetical protein